MQLHKTFAVTFLGFLANYEKCNGVIVILSYYKHHFTLVILVCFLSSSGAKKKKKHINDTDNLTKMPVFVHTNDQMCSCTPLTVS